MAIYSDLGGQGTVAESGITEAEALLEAKKVSGYLGLLSAYYFGGVGTSTLISSTTVNQWVDVNLTVDPAGTFDYRPQDMVDADASGFSGAGTAGSARTAITVTGNIDNSVSEGTSVDLGNGLSFVRGSTRYWQVYLDGAYGYSFSYNNTTGVPEFNQVRELNGVEIDITQLVSFASATTATSTSNESAADPFLFSLAGMTQQSFGKMRVTGLFNPDIDESQLDVRLLFTPNSSGAFGQFSIAEQAATMTQGAGVEYFVEPTITFFVGNTIEDLGSGDFGKFQLQIRSTVEGEFTLRGMTCYYHS